MQHLSRRRRVRRSLIAAAVLALTAPFACPAVAPADDDTAAVAGTGVARLGVVDGTVAIARGDANASVPAVVNAPVYGADYVTTGPQSLAEIQFDGKTAVRLGENVQMRFSHIDAGNRQLQLAAGTIEFRSLRGSDGQTDIDTPSISIVPRATGSYRVTVADDGTTLVTVRSGHADVETPQGAQRLDPGTTLLAQGTASDPQISERDEIARDDFDAFNADRDRAARDALADATYASPEYADAADASPTYASPAYVSPAYVSPAFAPYPAVGVWAAVAVPSYATPRYPSGYLRAPLAVRPSYAMRSAFWRAFVQRAPLRVAGRATVGVYRRQ